MNWSIKTFVFCLFVCFRSIQMSLKWQSNLENDKRQIRHERLCVFVACKEDCKAKTEPASQTPERSSRSCWYSAGLHHRWPNRHFDNYYTSKEQPIHHFNNSTLFLLQIHTALISVSVISIAVSSAYDQKELMSESKSVLIEWNDVASRTWTKRFPPTVSYQLDCLFSISARVFVHKLPRRSICPHIVPCPVCTLLRSCLENV